ncbi:hypothetical protein BD770DRAFT_405844 [Pilaira anomala]|nr:hypothetical protein BD770DRAFT_405844 [Pilaira anomala]
MELFHFGTSFSKSNSASNTEYLAYEKGQRTNKCLKSLNLLDHLVYLLEEVDYNQFNATLWLNNVDPTSFLISNTVPEYMSNHERAYFIEGIIPSMLSLAKNTGFIEFKWSETQFYSTKTLNLANYDYDLPEALPCKNIDALRILSTQNNMELIVIESSSGKLKEHTTHTIENIGMRSSGIEDLLTVPRQCLFHIHKSRR